MNTICTICKLKKRRDNFKKIAQIRHEYINNINKTYNNNNKIN